MRPTVVSVLDGSRPLGELGAPLPLDRLVPGGGSWEVELGFGKGRFLLERAAAAPRRRFLGVEMVGKYECMLVRRARRRRLANWLSLRGEALYLLSAVLPRGFAEVVHVYFPDPWPKARHHKRRLFDPQTVDLVLGLLRPGGTLCFATDFLDYGELVVEILAGYPGVEVRRRDGLWPDGPRTNYEAKYVAEGRPILRLEAVFAEAPQAAPPPRLHPAAGSAVVSAHAAPARAD
jgi:tRNA (guanine-N7-)-methyltransferase